MSLNSTLWLMGRVLTLVRMDERILKSWDRYCWMGIMCVWYQLGSIWLWWFRWFLAEKGHLILRRRREGSAVVGIVVELNCARYLRMDESCRCLIPNNVVAYSNKKYWTYLTILHPYDTTCIRSLKWSKSPLLNFADIIIFSSTCNTVTDDISYPISTVSTYSLAE